MAQVKHLDAEAMSRRIAQALSLRGWTQSDLSARSGVTTGHISMILSGNRARPSADVVYRLAGALEVSADWLLGLPSRTELGTLPPDEAELLHLYRIIPNQLIKDMMVSNARVQAQLFEHD